MLVPAALRRRLERVFYNHGLVCASHPVPVIMIVMGKCLCVFFFWFIRSVSTTRDQRKNRFNSSSHSLSLSLSSPPSHASPGVVVFCTFPLVHRLLYGHSDPAPHQVCGSVQREFSLRVSTHFFLFFYFFTHRHNLTH